MSTRYLQPDSPRLLGLLALLVSLGPLSIDMYLPAMPGMVQTLGTTPAAVQLTISTYLAGFAVFHLAVGPLADRFGRRPVLIAGLLLFIAACMGCALSRSIEELLAFRFLQGIAACVGPTLGRAIVRDVFGPTRAARALSIMAMLMALAPAVAPTVGGLMLEVLPWPSIFVFLALYSLLTLWLIHRLLAETLPQRQSLRPLPILRNYITLLRSGAFVRASVGSALIYAGMLAYLACSAFVFIEMLDVPRAWFGGVFLTTVAGYISGSAISARLARRHSSDWLMSIGGLLALAAMLSMLASTELVAPSVLGIMLPMTVYTCALGILLPHAMATSMHDFPHMAGTASALFGFIQMALSATAAAAVAAMLGDTPRPMVWVMLALTATAVLLIQSHRRAMRNTEAEAG